MPQFNNKNAFQQILYQRRQGMGKGNRNKTKSPQKQNWIYPHSAERKYSQKIKEWIKPLTETAKLILQANLMNWVREYNLTTEKQDSIRADDFTAEMTATIEELEGIAKEAANEDLRMMIVDIGYDTSEQNAKQWSKFTEKILGLKFFPYEPWESEVIKVWAQNNFKLITSLTNEYIKELNLMVSEGVQNAATAKSMEDAVKTMLQKSNKIADKFINTRTRLIARDQVGKLTESFTRRRQTDAGIDMYIWATVGDERVRRNHRAMQGRLCRWDNPTVYSDDGGKTWKMRSSIGGIQLHTGIDIQCRCSAIPYFNDVIAEVDNEIDMKTFPKDIPFGLK